MYICICMYVYVCMYLYVCICMHVYICMYMCLCIHVCVCMHNILGGILRGGKCPTQNGRKIVRGELSRGEIALHPSIMVWLCQVESSSGTSLFSGAEINLQLPLPLPQESK